MQGKKNFGTCKRIHSLEEQEYGHMTAENVVFAFQMPLPKNNMHLTFSRWQQSLIGVLSLDIEYEEEVDIHFLLNALMSQSFKFQWCRCWFNVFL